MTDPGSVPAVVITIPGFLLFTFFFMVVAREFECEGAQGYVGSGGGTEVEARAGVTMGTV